MILDNDAYFPIRVYSKKELALCYFPDSDPKVAVNRLVRWINRNQELMDELEKAGYNKNIRTFCPRQVKAIVKFLGEP